MLKALIKKQFMQYLSAFTFKSGKKSSKMGIVYAVLFLYLAAVFGIMIFFIMNMLCPQLVEMGLGWLYFTYAIILSLLFSVIGSIFTAQNQLYDASDNELLSALPIPPGYILFCRMLPLYIQCVVFTAVVMIPSCIAYSLAAEIVFAHILIWLLTLLILPLFSLVPICLIGWLSAVISSKIGRKSLFAVIICVLFLVGYFYVYSQFMKYMQLLILYSEKIGVSIRSYLYFFYKYGCAAEGSVSSAVIVLLLSVLIFTVMYIVLSLSYTGIITSKRGEVKKKYHEKELKVSSQSYALFKKEAARFVSSPVYLMNCGIGSILLIIIAVLALIKGGWLIEYINTAMPTLSGNLVLICCSAVLLISSMNAVTASSISLEGKNLWILKSSPVSGVQILSAKLWLHCAVTTPAAVICNVILAIVLHADFITAALMMLIPPAAVLLFGEIGLLLNLKFPNFTWENEAYPVKQSASAGLALLSGFLINLCLIGLYFIFGRNIQTQLFLFICFVLLLTASLVLLTYIRHRGNDIIASL